MVRKKHSPEKRRWIFQRLSGIPLMFCAATHIGLFFFKLEKPLRFEQVNRLFSRPEWLLFYSLFAVLAVYHGFSGLWTVMTDHNPSLTFKKNLKIILLISGSVLTAFGIWTFIMLGRS